ncbi:MAG: hypothetical protein A2W34_03650 [Chloroflexi bacterium RBG_16_64_32]|jgi:hypothetical protein|nr:MAG: hypothetical protein A2W34_03650 [Chloroflexi bacterium RBG_16_64_32]
MTTTTEASPRSGIGDVRPGDRVLILDAPSWCRRYFTGKAGEVVRVLPFPGGDVWVRFERPVTPWCERMDPVEEFPFSPRHLAAA